MGIQQMILGASGGGANVINIVIASNTQAPSASYNITAQPGYVAGSTTLRITINSGVYVWSDSTGTPALSVTGGSGADKIEIVNNGYVMGKGGAGSTNSTAGLDGGTAISISLPLLLDCQNGYVAGGGGGGGSANPDKSFCGGGGGGAGGGAGGAGMGSYGAGGAGGAINSVGADGTQGPQIGSGGPYYAGGGGGGGRIIPGTGGSAGPLGGPGGGAGGAGGTSNHQPADFLPGSGGSGINPGVSNTGSGGGGGWGAAGGAGGAFGGGVGGKGITTNGNAVTYVNGTASSSRVYGT
jgi:hypothetical protein